MIVFSLNEKEEKDYTKWAKKHKKCHQLKTFSFTPTGIGPTTEVECGCGSKVDITDYKSW